MWCLLRMHKIWWGLWSGQYTPPRPHAWRYVQNGTSMTCIVFIILPVCCMTLHRAWLLLKVMVRLLAWQWTGSTSSTTSEQWRPSEPLEETRGSGSWTKITSPLLQSLIASSQPHLPWSAQLGSSLILDLDDSNFQTKNKHLCSLLSIMVLHCMTS